MQNHDRLASLTGFAEELNAGRASREFKERIEAPDIKGLCEASETRENDTRHPSVYRFSILPMFLNSIEIKPLGSLTNCT